MASLPSFGRLARRVRRALPWTSKSRVQWVYSDRYNPELPLAAVDLHRSERLLSYLEREGILRSGDLHRARRVTMRHLLRVHELEYLRSLETAEGLSRAFGVPVQAGQIDILLLWQRAMVGGTILAARIALRDGIVLTNIAGGLHHANAERGQGYCLFNDVAVAIRFLRRRHRFRGRVLVVDLDIHDGDGTRSIFANDSSVHTFSIHNRTLLDIDAAEDTCVELGPGVGDAEYLGALRERLLPVVDRFEPELVFYLAGVDVAHDDRHGDWQISGGGVIQRDQLVMEAARPAGSERPVVVVNAGGYGRNAWRYSARFYSWMALGRVIEPPATDDLPLAAWRRIVRRLSEPLPESAKPSRDPDDWGLSADDLPGPGYAPQNSLLGRYPVHAVELALERLGLLHRLRALGYEHLKVEADLHSEMGQGLRVVSVAPERRVLFELRGRIDAAACPGFRTLFVEWMLSQNPDAPFHIHRPGLEGQEAPGLNILADVASLLILAAEHHGLDGLVFVPTHFSLAFQSLAHARCIDPRVDGQLRAIQALLRPLDFLAAVRAVKEGRVREIATDEPWTWTPTTLIVPVSTSCKAHFEAPEYRNAASKAQLDDSFYLMERSVD